MCFLEKILVFYMSEGKDVQVNPVTGVVQQKEGFAKRRPDLIWKDPSGRVSLAIWFNEHDVRIGLQIEDRKIRYSINKDVLIDIVVSRYYSDIVKRLNKH